MRWLNCLRLLDLDVGEIRSLLIPSNRLLILLIGATEIVVITLQILWLVSIRAAVLGEREGVRFEEMGVARSIWVDVRGLSLGDRLAVRPVTTVALNRLFWHECAATHADLLGR